MSTISDTVLPLTLIRSSHNENMMTNHFVYVCGQVFALICKRGTGIGLTYSKPSMKYLISNFQIIIAEASNSDQYQQNIQS